MRAVGGRGASGWARAAVRAFALLCALAALARLDPATAQDTRVGIRLSTDDGSVHVGDSVTVEVESVGLLEPLDAALLFVGADLLRETAGTRIAVVEGRVVDVATRRVELLPRAEGVVTFGPLVGETASGPVRSNALAVTVLPPADDAWVPGKADAYAEVSVSDASPYVREQVVLDVVLRHRFPIADERVVLPALDGFDVLAVFESRRTVEAGTEDGDEGDDDRAAAPMRRVAWRWLLWPTRSGSVEIGPVRWSGTMVRSRTARGPVDTGTEPLELDVRPAPEGAGGGWWLPARGVRLTDAWSGNLAELRAGQSIERTLTLEAEGVLASHLPDVEPLASRSFTSVALGVEREQSVVDGRVGAQAAHRFRLTARSPVPVFLDTVRVPWWDVERDAAAEAIVPARRVDIGLPDRADLLADAALEGSGWSRLGLVLASVSVPAGVGSLSALLLLAGVTVTAFGWGPRRGSEERSPADGVELPSA